MCDVTFEMCLLDMAAKTDDERLFALGFESLVLVQMFLFPMSTVDWQNMTSEINFFLHLFYFRQLAMKIFVIVVIMHLSLIKRSTLK